MQPDSKARLINIAYTCAIQNELNKVNGMWRFVILGVVIVGVVITGISLIDTSATGEVSASAILANPDTDTSGFARAIGVLSGRRPAWLAVG